MSKDSFVSELFAELRRIGLDPNELGGLATDGDTDRVLAYLRSLPVGSSWSDVFPGQPKGWSPSAPRPHRSLGAFDYRGPPWSVVVFASIDAGDPATTGDVAIERAKLLGFPIYGAGVILDKGHPHLYIVLTRDGTEAQADAIADALRFTEGIGNAWAEARNDRTSM